MKALATIIKPGLSTTLQDLGRPGKRHLGVALSGGADTLSLALANAALGNPANAVTLECTLSGPVLRFEHDAAFALAGADMNARINDAPAPSFQRIEARSGDILGLGKANAGARAYIAFAGGLVGDEFLDSRSTFLPAALGGLNGRVLRAGDALRHAGLATRPPRDIARSLQPVISQAFVLRATPGPEAPLFADAAERFFAAGWRVARRIDRMGAQLDGQRLEAAHQTSMASSPVFPGTVQCARDGAPFLLMADAQTVGGYSRIAQVIGADLYLTGQLRPGATLWFRKTTPADARDIARKKTLLFGDLAPSGLFY